MNLSEILKQFRNITPDPFYKEKSKRMVLASAPIVSPVPAEPLKGWSVRQMIFHILETGIAVALGVFFIFVITGQFSNIPYVSPVKFSVINPETLHAEAQAVDIQIQLAQVAYQESTSTNADESTPRSASAAASKQTFTILPVIASSSNASSTTNGATAQTSTSSTASSTLSVDQALQALSQ